MRKSARNSCSKPLNSKWLCSSFLAVLLVLWHANTARAQKPCPTGPISFVFVDNHSIFDTSDPGLDRRFGWAYRAANALHVRTKRDVIQRELLFGPGDCYDPYLLQETERLLRSYDFLSQVDVFGVPQPDGSYHVIVDTRDQWSTSLDLRFGLSHGIGLEGFRVRESNLLGTGQELGFSYVNRDVTRDYSVAYGTRQLAGTRWDFNTSVGRTRAGTSVNEVVAYPFLGEVGRWAARQSFSREDQFFDYVSLDSTGTQTQHVLLPVREELFDVAIGTRFGGRGNTTILGAVLSYQDLSYPGRPQLAVNNNFDSRTDVDSAAARELADQSEQLGNIRLGVVVGQRNIWWVKKRGLDTMRGQQDVPLGADISMTFARSIAALERDNDLLASVRFYTAMESGPALFAGRVRLDARRDFQAPANSREWEDFYGEAELVNYWRPALLPRHTFFLRAATAASWNTHTPFQITLGGDRNLRGYRYDRFPGGRRLVFNAEDRVYFGWPLPDVLDLGGTFFVDAGRMWPGDVPFGYDSGWLATAGFGLRGSFPAGSRSTFRLDASTPLLRGARLKDFRFTLSASELLGLAGIGISDPQLLRSRNEGAAGELFRFRGQ